MPEKKERTAGKARGTARRRTRFSSDDGGSRLSRPLLAAMIVILAGAAYLFWPRGGAAPAGIGEQLTVVTADSTIAPAPRSGSVEIQAEQQALVPEIPDGAAAEPKRIPEPAAAEPEVVEPVVKPVEKPAPKPVQKTESKPTPTQPEPPAITPRPSGSWAVQIGAYENEANAQKLVTRLIDKGVDAHVRAAGTSDGSIVYRVWIGWFSNRQEALDYARQERKLIGESYPVHR